MIVSELTNQDRAAWDNYVEQSRDGLPLHLSGWKDVLHKTYRFDTPYCLARDAGRIVGVLPLFAMRSALVGKTLTTPPGGLLADSDEVAAALLDAGRDMARRMKLGRLVLHDSRRAWPGELRTSSHHVAWITDLCADLEKLWRQVDRNVRRQVRKGQENNLRVEFDRDGHLVDDFHMVMSRFTHEMGTPVFGRQFIQNTIEAFPGRWLITATYQDSHVLGAYFSMTLRKTTLGLWGSTIREYLPLHASYLAYWAMYEEAVRSGCEVLDMGRSPAGSGASQYKGQWGGYSVPVYQQVMSVDGRTPAEAIAGQVRTDSKFQTFTQLWTRLPLPVTRFLGPRLRRHVPFG